VPGLSVLGWAYGLDPEDISDSLEAEAGALSPDERPGYWLAVGGLNPDIVVLGFGSSFAGIYGVDPGSEFSVGTAAA